MNANEITYGVEIECTIPSAQLATNNWTIGAYHAGREIPGFAGWKAMRDGSIMPSDYSMSGVEVVSPILRGDDGLAQIDNMCAKLNAMGTAVNRSTGLHIHVGFSGDADALKRLIHLVASHEKALYAITGSRLRETGTYAQPIKDVYRSIRNMQTIADVRSAAEKYRLLNLSHLVYGGQRTVEFRCFAGTTNATKIKAYVQIVVGLVQKALVTKVTAQWDAKVRASQFAAKNGAGAAMAKRLLFALGWTGSKNRASFGAMSGKSFGQIDGQNLRPLTAEMMRLAKKYDDADPMRRVAVPAPVQPVAPVAAPAVAAPAVDDQAPW